MIDLQRLVRFFVLDSLLLLKKPVPNPKTLLIIRVDGIGDYILFRNFLEVIKNSIRFQNYKITLCGSQAYKELALTYDVNSITDYLWVDNKKIKSRTFYRCKTFGKIRKRGYEVVLNPMYSRNSVCEDSIVRISGAIKKIGCVGDFVHAKSWEKYIFNRYYTELIDISPTTIFEFNKNKAFIEKVIATNISIRKPSLPSEPKPTTTMRYAVLCPGALLRKKRWQTKNYIQIARYLHLQYGIASILVGDIHDRPSNEERRTLVELPFITDMIGKNNLVQTIALIQGALLVVSNDTSIAHIGVAADVPVVVVSNGYHFGRFTEYPKEIYKSIFYVYPPDIMKSKLSFDELVAKFQYGSRLDIKTISLETVQLLIDKALNPLEFN